MAHFYWLTKVRLKKPNLSLLGICPQLSLQVMMGVGTPTAWQVNVTVDPRAASTDSSGGLTTVGGAAKSQNTQQLTHKMHQQNAPGMS